MCVVRISLRRGRSAEQLAILSEAVNEALVEGYGMDPDDTFQIFEQLAPEELVFDRHYKVDQPRSADFLLFSIVGGPTSADRKHAFYRRLVELLDERAGVRPQDVFVGLQDATAESWSFGGGKPLR